MAIKRKEYRNIPQEQLNAALENAAKDYYHIVWYETPKGSGFKIKDSEAHPLRWFAFNVFDERTAFQVVLFNLNQQYGSEEAEDFRARYLEPAARL